MWFVISVSNKDHKYVIHGGKSFSIGRKDCDILVPGDGTVSRKHAELSMSHSEANLINPTKLPILLLKDLSKFGTWVNNQRVDKERILKDGDSVYFGSTKSSFMIVYEPLIVTSSCLDNASKKSLRQILCTLGGHMVSEWTRDCSLLVMSKISVTIKVICALVSQKSVVTPDYLHAYLKHLQGASEKPDPNMFSPEVAESQLDPSEVTFATDARRKTLFQGQIFVFLSQKQFKKMSLAIELAGGTPMLMSGDSEGDLDLVTAPGTVVMNCSDQGASQQAGDWVSQVQDALNKSGKHMIADAELGYAVLYSSTEKHCNPDYNAGETTFEKLPSQTLSQADVYVEDTVPQHRQATQPSSQAKKSRLCKQTDTPADIATQNRTSQRSRPQESSSSTAAPATINVKEEVRDSSDTPRTSRKRGRIEEVQDSDEDDDIFTRKKIKTEPITPNKEAAKISVKQIKDSDKPAKTVTKPTTSQKPSEKATKPSDKPAKGEPKQAAAIDESVWDSDNDDLDYSKILGDIDEAVKNTPRRTSPRRSPRHSPTRSTEVTKETCKSRSRSRSRSRSPKPSKTPVVKKETLSFSVIDDIEMDSASNVRENRSKSPQSSSVKSRSKTTRSEEVEPEGSRSEGNKKTESKRKTTRRPIIESDDEREIESEDGESNSHAATGGGKQNSPAIEEEDKSDDDANRADERNGHVVPEGFLTKVKSEQDLDGTVIKQDPDADLPRGCVQVEVVSLVVRRPKPSHVDNSGDCPEGYTRWKGKIIRNFKKFRKTENCGANKLPKIIGGSDLEVHQGQRSKELDEWMNDASQAESQSTREDKRAQAIFDYNPGVVKRRGR